MIDTAPAPVTAEPRPKTPREVCEHAARYIEEHGWWRNNRPYDEFVEAGATCASNAITYVGGDLLVQHAFAQHLGVDGLGDIFEWNDAPERTKAEVLAALRSVR